MLSPVGSMQGVVIVVTPSGPAAWRGPEADERFVADALLADGLGGIGLPVGAVEHPAGRGEVARRPFGVRSIERRQDFARQRANGRLRRKRQGARRAGVEMRLPMHINEQIGGASSRERECGY